MSTHTLDKLENEILENARTRFVNAQSIKTNELTYDKCNYWTIQKRAMKQLTSSHRYNAIYPYAYTYIHTHASMGAQIFLKFLDVWLKVIKEDAYTHKNCR